MDKDFADWLVDELKKRDWSQADLARLAGVNRQVISTYINRQRSSPDPDVLNAIAHAFKIPPEIVFRAAGILPPAPDTTEVAEEMFHLFTQLPPGDQQEMLELLRFKVERKATIKVTSRKKSPARSV